MIDMGPIRREMLRQVLPNGKRFEDLKPEERQRIAAEVNQRLLGIQQGIQIGAAELQKRAIGGARRPRRPRRPRRRLRRRPKPPRRRTARRNLSARRRVTGSQIAVNVERNGEVVRSLNAEINVPNLLATVFSNTRRDRGEVPFAVAKDGTLHTRTEDDKARVAALGDVAKPGGPAMSAASATGSSSRPKTSRARACGWASRVRSAIRCRPCGAPPPATPDSACSSSPSRSSASCRCRRVSRGI